MVCDTGVVIGCCGWSEGRQKYFQHFPGVELQSTFYEPPSLALAQKWREQTPLEFHFCLKAWQLITHTTGSPTYRKLKSKLAPGELELVGAFQPTEQVMLAWERTLSVARALAARVILFQCPASFRPEAENVRNFRQFFDGIDRPAMRLAWEPRGPWPMELVQTLCRDLDLDLCLDPFKAETLHAESVYWRLHGRGGYSYRYTDSDLQELLQLYQECRARTGNPRYVFFNNVWMKADALRFQQLVTQGSLTPGDAAPTSLSI